ncbi:peptidylprolyl isomerase [Rhodobacterales bacterium HKCCE2091]|nr:peptidylprolyl isomerase [Rhodobacterales bacterium HKCCE2091]
MRSLLLGLCLLAAGPAFATGLEIDVDGEAKGTIVIDLFEEIAPLHVERITALAASGAYDGVVFHRVIDRFMAQTGDVEYGRLGQDMRYAGRGGSDMPDLPPEFSDMSFERGIVGMARGNDPASANSQFFIMFAPEPRLDNAYTIVGRVVEGMEIVDAIKRGLGPNGAVIGEPDRMVALRVRDDDPVPPPPDPAEGEEGAASE